MFVNVIVTDIWLICNLLIFLFLLGFYYIKATILLAINNQISLNKVCNKDIYWGRIFIVKQLSLLSRTVNIQWQQIMSNTLHTYMEKSGSKIPENTVYKNVFYLQICQHIHWLKWVISAFSYIHQALVNTIMSNGLFRSKESSTAVWAL